MSMCQLTLTTPMARAAATLRRLRLTMPKAQIASSLRFGFYRAVSGMKHLPIPCPHSLAYPCTHKAALPPPPSPPIFCTESATWPATLAAGYERDEIIGESLFDVLMPAAASVAPVRREQLQVRPHPSPLLHFCNRPLKGHAHGRGRLGTRLLGAGPGEGANCRSARPQRACARGAAMQWCSST